MTALCDEQKQAEGRKVAGLGAGRRCTLYLAVVPEACGIYRGCRNLLGWPRGEAALPAVRVALAFDKFAKGAVATTPLPLEAVTVSSGAVW